MAITLGVLDFRFDRSIKVFSPSMGSTRPRKYQLLSRSIEDIGPIPRVGASRRHKNER
jgi:hypothetical protein